MPTDPVPVAGPEKDRMSPLFGDETDPAAVTVPEGTGASSSSSGPAYRAGDLFVSHPELRRGHSFIVY